MCGVWVALEDIDMDNGPLVYYPGSHKFPDFKMADAELRAEGPSYGYYERFLMGVIRGANLQAQYGTLRKGQALLWAANLLHGGSKQKDKSRSRLSQVTHYYFEGCRYYTPLYSEGDQILWRDPEWIR